jgi:hypothetical protein
LRGVEEEGHKPEATRHTLVLIYSTRFACLGFSRLEHAGGVAQLGERLNGIQEVRGSIPLTSIPASLPIRLADSFGESLKIAGIAQLVEHNLAKVGVAGSSPVSRFQLKGGKGDLMGATARQDWAVSSVG